MNKHALEARRRDLLIVVVRDETISHLHIPLLVPKVTYPPRSH